MMSVQPKGLDRVAIVSPGTNVRRALPPARAANRPRSGLSRKSFAVTLGGIIDAIRAHAATNSIQAPREHLH